MATITFHPTSDITLGHSCSTGSTGWNLLGSNDGDSTYINGRCNSSDTKTYTSNFGFSGAFDKAVIVKSIAIYVVGRTLSTNNKDTKNYSINLSINGTAGTAKSGTLDGSYTTYSNTYAQGLPSSPITDISQLNLNLQITNSGKQESSKTDAFNNYFTEAYIVVTYEESTIPSYKCAAIAGANIDSVSVSSPTVLDGESVTFTAVVSQHCTFDGWYTSASGGTPISGNTSYTVTIHDHTTLYARATKIVYTVQVGSQPEDGNANVNAATATYGDVVTFTANVTGVNREFYGWYSDSSYTNLVNASATYNHTVTGNTTLYPRSGKKRYTAILHPTYASDVRPYRGSSSVGVKAASPSVPQNVNVLANNTVNSSTYAYQSYRASTVHNYGIAFWINKVEQLNSAPDNATIVDLYAQIGVSFSDTNYDSASIYSGTYTYICEGDETPAIQRGTAVSIPISTSKNIVTINKSQMGNWTIKELKEGNLGFQINTAVKSASGTRQQRFYGIDVYVVYTIEDTSYKCEAISDGHVDVSVSSHDVVPGGSCTWTAIQEGGYRFDGWYSDSNFENPVSASATYTTTINNNKTLYAKTHYHSRVVARELDIPFGQGSTYFIGKDINGKTLDPAASGSGWKPDFDMSSYGWLASLVGVTDVKATAASCNGPEYVSAVINSTGMNVLYPNDTAHPVKMDSHAMLGRAAITATVFTSTLTNPVTEADTIAPMVDGVQSRIWRPKNINDIPYDFTNLRLPSILKSTRNSTIEYRMHQYARSNYRAIGIDNIRLILYFEEYDFSAQIGTPSKGIEAVATNKAVGYEGDSVTFTAVLLPGVTWNGWYADPECTILVSADQTYTTTPNHDLTLYASATTNLEIYSVSAVAGENITTATCNHNQMTAGGNKVEFNATVPPHYTFDGWYTEPDYSNQVSTSASYSHTITGHTVLYARAVATVYSVTVLQGESGIAEATPPAGAYGTHTQLSWVSNDEWYEFDHWETERGTPPTPFFYSTQTDDYTTIPSGSETGVSSYVNYYTPACNYRKYNTTVAKLTLNQSYTVIWDGVEYPNIQAKPCRFTVASATFTIKLGAGSPDEPFCLVTDNSDASSIYTYETNISWPNKPSHTISVYDAEDFDRQWDVLSNQNPYDYTITDHSVIRSVVKEIPKIYVTPVAGEGITSVSVDKEYAKPGGQVVLSAVVSEDYEFDGWYSNSGYGTLLSKDEVFTYTINSSLTTSQEIKVYAKAKSVLRYIHIVAENTPENPIADRLWGYWVDGSVIGDESYELYDAVYSGDPSRLPAGSCSRFAEVSNNGVSLLTLDLPFHPQKDGKKVAALFAHSIQENKTIITKIKATSPEETSSDLSPVGEKCVVFTGDQYIELAQQTNNTCYIAWENENKCSCNVEVDEGAKAWAPSECKQGETNVECNVFIRPGYELIGVFLDEGGTIPLEKFFEDDSQVRYSFATPASEDGSPTSITIYVKTKKVFEDTGVFVKINGTQRQAIKVYKKVNGVYVEQTDPQSVFDSTKHYKIIAT